jgi:tripartite-type tricarboxylate transporter receptor subunit TctC
MKRRHVLAAGASLLSAPAFVRAQSAWPSRGPIRLVAQFPPGGLVDTVSRLMAPHLSMALGQSVVVENRPGAGGLIGTDFVSKQPADGYTLLVSHAAVHVYATATRRTMPFDAVADFTHMGLLLEAPMVLVVRSQSPFQSLAQYVEAAKSKPVRYGTSGIGSANHLYGELLKIEGKAPNHDHVPYQGSAPAMQDLLAGNIESVFDPITTNVATLKAGSLRALAVSTPKRLPALHPHLRRTGVRQAHRVAVAGPVGAQGAARAHRPEAGVIDPRDHGQAGCRDAAGRTANPAPPAPVDR